MSTGAGNVSIVWFRQDLRLTDNPALTAAAARGAPILPLYIHDELSEGLRAPGGASRWWLAGSLETLADSLKALGLPLILRRGPAQQVLADLVTETGAAAVYWNRCYEPFAIARDSAIKAALRDRGVLVESSNGALLHEPWVPKTKTGGPFKVFTPFWRHLQTLPVPDAPLPTPDPLPGGAEAASDDLAAWALRPSKPDWAGGLLAAWSPGETGARKALTRFLNQALPDYQTDRDFPARPGTSRLSPHLHWGEISPCQVWQAVQHRAEALGNSAAPEAYLREIAWREFNHHLLYHWPEIPRKNWKAGFDAFPWRDDPAGLDAWQRGRTGFPIVDAGMRELWSTGWMHNRVRMIAASFLIKDLLIDWRQGEAWFWDTLVDADLANNAGGWQWVAGSGADAAPFFRIFNPVSQSRKFDPAGGYLRRWLPELAALPDAAIHAPWEAKPGELAAAGVALGDTYPKPVVDHAEARKLALAAYRVTRTGN